MKSSPTLTSNSKQFEVTLLLAYNKSSETILEFVVQRDQQLLRKCSLIDAQQIVVDERVYCLNKHGKMNQPTAIKYCMKLNATLPLPMSLLEFEVFSNFSKPNKSWIGISDPSNSGKKENWRDVKNKRPAYVK